MALPLPLLDGNAPVVPLAHLVERAEEDGFLAEQQLVRMPADLDGDPIDAKKAEGLGEKVGRCGGDL